MTTFGNRDAGYGTSPSVPAAGALPSLDATLAPEPVFGAASARGFGSPNLRRVILRVEGEDDILVGSADSRETAVQIARDLVRHIEHASARGEWPQIDDRFIRPGAIISIDVQRPE